MDSRWLYSDLQLVRIKYFNFYRKTKTKIKLLLHSKSVIPTYKEPIVGWIDNMYGATGIIVGVGVGLLRVLQIDQHNNAEIVPVDMTCNSLICSAWDVANNEYEEPPVYNFVTSQKNPITWKQFCEWSTACGGEIPYSKSVWHFRFTMSTNKFLVALMKFFYHILPAFLIDTGLVLVGKKPK